MAALIPSDAPDHSAEATTPRSRRNSVCSRIRAIRGESTTVTSGPGHTPGRRYVRLFPPPVGLAGTAGWVGAAAQGVQVRASLHDAHKQHAVTTCEKLLYDF